MHRPDNVVGWGLLGVARAWPSSAMMVAIVAPIRSRSMLVGVLTAAVGVAGVAAGSAAMAGSRCSLPTCRGCCRWPASRCGWTRWVACSSPCRARWWRWPPCTGSATPVTVTARRSRGVLAALPVFAVALAAGAVRGQRVDVSGPVGADGADLADPGGRRAPAPQRRCARPAGGTR